MDYNLSSCFVISKERFLFSFRKHKYKTTTFPFSQKHQRDIIKISTLKQPQQEHSSPSHGSKITQYALVNWSTALLGMNLLTPRNGINASYRNACHSLRGPKIPNRSSVYIDSFLSSCIK